MLLKRTLLLWIIVLISGTLISVAQDDAMTLRELADENDVYLGSAVYTYHLDNATHAEILSTQFNMITPEHEAKMCVVQPQPEQFDFRAFDELVEFAEANDMTIRGHALVWHGCEPAWIQNGDFSREEAIGILRDHIYTVVGRYKGRIKYWDVVNEGISDNALIRVTPFKRFIGEDYIDLAFQFAHEADPDAILFYNDYGAEGMNRKSNAIYDLVSGMVERDIPIHGVGLQGHFTLGDNQTGSWAGPDNLNANINRLGELGLEVHFTEVDIRYSGEYTDDIAEQQANEYFTLASVCIENPHCTTLVTWGVTDRYTWLRDDNLGFYENPTASPLMFDDQYQPKLAYYAVIDAFRSSIGLEPLEGEVEFSIPTEEPRIVVEIPEPTKSDEAQLSPDSVMGAVYYAAFPVSITLDGDVSDWENVPRVTIDNGTLVPENNDTTLTFAAVADADNLYLLAEVQDSNIVYGNYDPTAEWWREDSIEFYLNTTGDLDATFYDDGIVQIGIAAASLDAADGLIIGGVNSEQAQVTGIIVESDTGYTIELAVPLVTEVWSIEPQHLDVLGFQAHLNGASGDDRDTKLIWSVYDTEDQSWNNPSLFGELIIWDVSQ